MLSNPGARCEPDPTIGGLAGAWAACVADAVAEVERRQRARRQIGYDRLVSDLAAALADPRRRPAARRPARRPLPPRARRRVPGHRPAAVGDLRPRLRRHRLITVGDPKQAIFRFRGADVHAYLDAVRSAERATLRTEPPLRPAAARRPRPALRRRRLGHADIEFARVDAEPDARRTTRSARPPCTSASCPTILIVPHTSQGIEAGAAAALVLADVASRVRTLLDTGADRHRAQRRSASGRRTSASSSRRSAAPRRRPNVLREWGIPTVRARTGSVLRHRGRVAVAAAARRRSPRRRRAGRPGRRAVVVLRPRPAELVATSRAAPVRRRLARSLELQRRLAALGERMRRDGVGALYEELRADAGSCSMPCSDGPNGDRDLTDLDHLAELLVAELGRTPERAGCASPKRSTA